MIKCNNGQWEPWQVPCNVVHYLWPKVHAIRLKGHMNQHHQQEVVKANYSSLTI